MSDSDDIIRRLENARLIVRDNLSFIYLMSEHQSDMHNYGLGSGAFVSAISLLAAINFLAKIHHVLSKGTSCIVGHEQQAAYQSLVDKIKQSSDVPWAEAKIYIRKPRLGDINEADAFSNFIKACPIDFGIDKSEDTEVRKIWATYRNKLTHIISLAGDLESGQMLITTKVSPSQPGMYKENLKFIQTRLTSYKPFDITPARTKNVFIGRTDIDHISLQHILKDKCYVDRLTIAVDMAIDWLINTLRDENYIAANCATAKEWLDKEMQSQSE